MSEGRLWFDNSRTELSAKVQKAVDLLSKKYGFQPNMCFVHPSMMGKQAEIVVGTVTVRPYRFILPSHFWIGIEDKN